MKMKLWINALVAILAVSLFLGGCAPAGGDVLEATDDTATQGTQDVTSLPSDSTEDTGGSESTDDTQEQTQTEDPTDTGIGDIGLVVDPIGGSQLDGSYTQAVQLRLTSMSGNWWVPFDDGNGSYGFVADSANGLLEGLKGKNISVDQLDLSAYDDAFFRDNRLAVIPRASNSGSVRYHYTLTPTADGVQIQVQGVTPEIATADMADWLVLVPVSLAEYGADTSITVDPAGSSFATNTVNQ